MMDTPRVLPHPDRLLDLVLDLDTHGVLMADSQGRVIYGNPTACAMLGYSTLELETLVHVTDIYYRPDDARRVMRSAREDNAIGVEVMVRTRSGELVPARVHARVHRDGEGNTLGTVGVIEDLREVVDLNRRLEEAARQVISSERRAAVLDASTQMANELNQPLMAAMGNIELTLMEPALDSRTRGRLERVYEQLERLQALSADFARRVTTRSSG
jgi:PAS domain S-box-containing protein